MTDGIDVSSGGAVAIDTASLDDAAHRLDAVADTLVDLADRTRRAVPLLESASSVSGGAGVHRAQRAVADLDTASGRARLLGSSLRESARIYEIVELENGVLLARAAGDDARADAAAAQLALARQADPTAAAHADDVLQAWRTRWALDASRDVAAPLLLGDPVSAIVLGLLAPWAIRARGGGLVPRGATLDGPASAVVVAPAPTRVSASVAPSSLAAMVRRVPDAGAARVRVERYDMPDGTREFAVYVAGTEEWIDSGGDEPFDTRSNEQLYAGEDSASYEAVRAALDDAGARPGDALDLVGFSQGGMVASWLAQDPNYDVRSFVGAGSPTAPDLGPGTLVVDLEHTDDLVAALQGGSGASPAAIEVRRTVDPAVGPQDLALPAHRLEEYAVTAGLFEQSGDPRVAPVQDLLDRLATATSVTATAYTATRVR